MTDSDRRVERWEARGWLREQSSLARVRGCGTRVIVSKDDHESGIDPAVKVVFGGEMEAAGIRGLSSCGSVWACPRCAARIGIGRAAEIRRAFEVAEEHDAMPLMMTRTAGHPIDWSLSDSWGAVLTAWRRVTAARAWGAFRDRVGLLGSIRATEVTLSPRAGWHVHIHTILFVRDPFAALASEPGLVEMWTIRAGERGLTVNGAGQGLQVPRDPDALPGYLTKAQSWDLAAEAAMGASKVGRGESATPFELLARAVAGDDTAARDWRAFEEGSRGRSSLMWSRGLRGTFGIEATSDDDLASMAGDGSEVARIDPATWQSLERDPETLVGLLRGVEAGEPFGTIV